MSGLRVVRDDERPPAGPGASLSCLLWWPDRPLQGEEVVILGMLIRVIDIPDGKATEELFRVTMTRDGQLWQLGKFEGEHPISLDDAYLSEFTAIERAHEWIRTRGRLKNAVLRHRGE